MKLTVLKNVLIALLSCTVLLSSVGCQLIKQVTGQNNQDKGEIATEDINSVRFAQVSGSVQFVKGNDTQWFEALPGMQLSLKDTLATKISSEADLDVDEGKHVLVGEEVRLVVGTLLKEVGQSRVTTLRVDTGSVYVRIQRKLNQEESFEVITPTCIMGVRGTHFVVEVVGGDTVISVIEGTVEGQLLTSDGQKPTRVDSTPQFKVIANERMAIPLGSEKKEDMIQSTLTPEQLPAYVLKQIEKEHEGLPEIYQQPLTDAISQSEANAKANGATLGSARLAVSGARYVDPLTGYTYARVDQASSFEEAKAWCEAQGGQLMTVSSAAEQGIAESLIAQGPQPHYLIGLVQKPGAVEPDQGFVWVSGESVSFERWHRDNGVQIEPNNTSQSGLPETHVTLSNAGTWPKGDWSDQNLDEIKGTYGFICQWQDIKTVGNPPSSDVGRIQRGENPAANINEPFEKIIASNGPWYTERLSLEDRSQLLIGYEGTYAIDPSIFSRATQMEFAVREDVMLTGITVPYKNPVSGTLSFTLQNKAGATFGPFAMIAQSAISVSMDQGARGGDAAALSLGETNYTYETTKPEKLEKGDYTLALSDPSGQVRTRQTGTKGAFLIKGVHAPSYEKYRSELDAAKDDKKGEKSTVGDKFEEDPDGQEKPPIMKQALFVLEKNSVIEEIVINTKNKGAGRPPGQVAIFDSEGELLYVEQAQSLPLNDVANGMWAIAPEIVLPPGTYEVGINDPLMFEYEANGNPMFYINVTETKPERTNFTGTYKINMDAYKRSTRMGPVTDNDSDFNLKDFELTVLDKGNTLELVGRYEGMPFSQEVKLSEASGNQLKGVFTFEADLTNLPTKQKITATAVVLILALDDDNIMFGIQGKGTYERAATKDKGADYNTYAYFVKGKRVTPELPGFVIKALGAAAVVGAGNIPGPADPIQAATGLLFPPLVGLVVQVLNELMKKAAEKALADKIKAEAAKGPKKYTREWYKAQNPNASDETIAMMMLGAAMENTDEPDLDPESMSSGESSSSDSGDSSDGDSGSEGSEGGASEGGDSEGNQEGDSEGDGSEGDSEGEGVEGEGSEVDSEGDDSEGKVSEGNADVPEETSRPLTEEDFKSLEEKAADAAKAEKGANGEGRGEGSSEDGSGDGDSEDGSGGGSRGVGSGGAKGSDKDSDGSQNNEPEIPQSMTVVTGIDGKTSTYEYNATTGTWVNPETGGEFNQSQYNELQKNLPGNQAAQDTERDKIARGDTEQDRQLAKMVADQKEKAYLNKIMTKYGVDTKEEAQAIITKNMATEQARSEKWQRIGNIAAAGEHVATGVVMGADAAVDFLASQTGPAGKVISAGYKITKSIASEVADKGYENSSISGAAIKGVADAATDFTDNKVLKGALTIGGETLGNYAAAKPGEEWDSIADGLVNGTVKVGSGLITDKLAGPGFGDEMSITKLTGGKVRVALNTDGKWMGAVVKASTGQRILDNKVTSQIVQSGTKIASSALDNYVVKPYFTDSVSEMAKNLPRN